MPDSLIWFVGNRSPSITETITSEGVPVDLTAATVKFKMRAVGADTLKVNTAAVIETPSTAGKVRYDWLSTDVDTPGDYLIWWEVTAGGKTEDMNEALIEFRAHGPQENTYVELEEFKATLELTGTVFADRDIRGALVAASRVIDSETGRRFYLDDDATQVRYYSGHDAVSRSGTWWDGFEWLTDAGWRLRIDDLVDITTLETDNDGDGVFENTWTEGTDFVLESRNAAADQRPYGEIRILRGGSFRFPTYPDAIKVTGQFGWASVPENVKIATSLLASRLLKLKREGTFGAIGFGPDGAVVRISRQIPDFGLLLEPYTRRRLFV